MKSKQQILMELYRTHFVENYARKIANDADRVFLDDIVGELYVIICELPERTITDIYNGCGINCFRRYISGIVVRQMRSENSKVYRLYKLHAQRHIPASMVENFETLWEESGNR
jgi:hypothetical protein